MKNILNLFRCSVITVFIYFLQNKTGETNENLFELIVIPVLILKIQLLMIVWKMVFYLEIFTMAVVLQSAILIMMALQMYFLLPMPAQINYI